MFVLIGCHLLEALLFHPGSSFPVAHTWIFSHQEMGANDPKRPVDTNKSIFQLCLGDRI